LARLLELEANLLRQVCHPNFFQRSIVCPFSFRLSSPHLSTDIN
jgi:hypothetical protein